MNTNQTLDRVFIDTEETLSTRMQGNKILVTKAPKLQATVIPAAVQKHPQIMSGAPTFVGTRVLISSLFSELAGGNSVDTFIANYPSVTRDDALRAMQTCYDALTEASRETSG